MNTGISYIIFSLLMNSVVIGLLMLMIVIYTRSSYARLVEQRNSPGDDWWLWLLIGFLIICVFSFGLLAGYTLAVPHW